MKFDCETYLSSDSLGVHRRMAIAFDGRIAGAGAEVVAKAAAGDPSANYAIGRYLLRSVRPWEAIPYLEEAALSSGRFDAYLDLALLLLFSGRANCAEKILLPS
jgi:hypothetical protein